MAAMAAHDSNRTISLKLVLLVSSTEGSRLQLDVVLPKMVRLLPGNKKNNNNKTLNFEVFKKYLKFDYNERSKVKRPNIKKSYENSLKYKKTDCLGLGREGRNLKERSHKRPKP